MADGTGKGGISGTAVAALFAGLVLAYSGLKGKGIGNTIRSLIAGGNPGTTPSINAPDTSSPTDPGAVVAGPGGTTSNMTNRQAGQLIASMNGWTGAEWTALDELWTRESGWSNTAQNPTSGAYGIAQALPPTKYPTQGQAPPTGTSDANAQIYWGVQYIAQRYGDPIKAWAHEQQYGWY